jgi:hypothetical protein
MKAASNRKPSAVIIDFKTLDVVLRFMQGYKTYGIIR